MLASAFARSRRRLFLLALPLVGLALLAACSDSATGPNRPSDPAGEVFAANLGVDLAQMTERASRLYVQDLVVGTGSEATAGRLLRTRYTGWLRTGVQFDSNATSGPLFEFTLGGRGVIDGWNIGLGGMRVGGKRRLVLGSQYGFGAAGSGSIPPHATLVFDVELVSIAN